MSKDKLRKLDERILEILRGDFHTTQFSREQNEMWEELHDLYMEITEELFNGES